jgi:hypothetical protein
MSQPIVMIIHQATPISLVTKGIWLVGVPICLFIVIGQSSAALADNYVSYGELFRVVAIACVALVWIHIKWVWEEQDSAEKIKNKSIFSLFSNGLSIDEHQLNAVDARMHELRQHHAIRQLHVLPFPYISQIYHLLNLKHLESVHSFSLNNLKITQVSGTHSTRAGGSIKFDTVLSSPANVLNIWRQRQVEVELKLLSPYTVELNIPVYGSKRMIVIFNVIPIESNKHQFLIDIYSDLRWPKFLLSGILHIASLLTLYEDLPYLEKLSTKNLACLRRYAKSSSRETMWLFQRFVELYVVTPQPLQSGSPC